MTIVKFGVGDVVRFIGTDRALTVKQYDPFGSSLVANSYSVSFG
jgi:hypothetical protein